MTSALADSLAITFSSVGDDRLHGRWVVGWIQVAQLWSRRACSQREEQIGREIRTKRQTTEETRSVFSFP